MDLIMEEAIKIVENKLTVIENIISSLRNGKHVESFLSRKYILQDVLKELKSANKK